MIPQTQTNKGETKPPVTDADLIEKLKEAPFYHTYQNAFRSATGLPLVLVSADRSAFNPFYASPNQNPFCRALNTGGSPCSRCVLAQKCALADAVERAVNIECFAGMKETAVPLRLGRRIVGYLKTGQVFTAEPSDTLIAELADALRAAGRSEPEIAELLRLHRMTPTFRKDRYASMVTMLSAFGLQLMTLANQILLEGRCSEPEAVRNAKRFIADHIDDKISLDAVAAAVNVSTFYLCKIFKRATNMTLTEYVNRQRIQIAKQKLLRTDRQITEIAYDVGYQSLSQFNRSFHRIVGESPSKYRKQESAGRGERYLVA